MPLCQLQEGGQWQLGRAMIGPSTLKVRVVMSI